MPMTPNPSVQTQLMPGPNPWAVNNQPTPTTMIRMGMTSGALLLDDISVLVIGIGALLLVAQLPAIPKPGWYVALPPPAEQSSASKKLRLEDAPGTPFGSPAEGGGRPPGGR
jgi:hypothetical protein